MNSIKLHCENLDINQTIHLDGSKSISNRLLIIKALSKSNSSLLGLSTSDDTEILKKSLENSSDHYDVGHAGTSFRFLTAYLSLQEGTHTLTGSARMKERPIGPLVDALNTLGANIEYLEKEGYPPLSINTPEKEWESQISIPSDISSQYISALLLIAPILKNGLKINFLGQSVSKSYIEMTTKTMEDCGIKLKWINNDSSQSIEVLNGTYQIETNYKIEADWSAASYYYAIAAFSNTCTLKLEGLFEKSTQGDQAIVEIGEKLGIKTLYNDKGVELIKHKNITPDLLEMNFLQCPDIAQTVITIAAGKGIHGLFSGLETLKIKETDRIFAMKTELEKIGVTLIQMPTKFSKRSAKQFYITEGKASVNETPVFNTYKDHRMAMSLASLAMLFDIQINKPEVVSKSYPKFWIDLEQLGIKST